MIQRIQTLYLLVVVIIAGIGLFWNFGDTFFDNFSSGYLTIFYKYF